VQQHGHCQEKAATVMADFPENKPQAEPGTSRAKKKKKKGGWQKKG